MALISKSKHSGEYNDKEKRQYNDKVALNEYFQSKTAEKIKMEQNYWNNIFLMEPSKIPEDISLKGGQMYLNRFAVEEDAPFELAGVYYLKEWSERNVEFSRNSECRARSLESKKIKKRCMP